MPVVKASNVSQSPVSGSPNEEKVHQIKDLHEPIAIEIRAGLITASAVVNVGQWVIIDGFVIRTAWEQTCPAVGVRIGVVVQGSRVCAT